MEKQTINIVDLDLIEDEHQPNNSDIAVSISDETDEFATTERYSDNQINTGSENTEFNNQSISEYDNSGYSDDFDYEFDEPNAEADTENSIISNDEINVSEEVPQRKTVFIKNEHGADDNDSDKGKGRSREKSCKNSDKKGRTSGKKVKVAPAVTDNDNEEIKNKTGEADEKPVEKKTILEGIRASFPIFGLDIVLFMFLLIFLEIALRIEISGKMTRSNMFLLAFVPSEALFLTLFCGWFKKNIINKILMLIPTLAMIAYYVIQLVYHNNFGSFFSAAMMGMGGDALGNFWWALKDTLIGSTMQIIVLFIPVIVVIVLIFAVKPMSKQITWPVHVISIVLVAGLWLGGIQALKIGGTDRQSAYYVYHNSMADTDTTSSKIGVLATTIVEGGTYLFGIDAGANDTLVASVDMSHIYIQPVVSSNSVSGNSTVVAEPSFVPEPWQYDAIDFTALKDLATDTDTTSLCEYFSNKQCTYTNEYTGMFEGYNLIYICAESFWEYAADEDANPTLYKMANNGIVLKNYYNTFLNTTTNGEYAYLTSLWPNVSRYAMCGTDVGSFPQSAEKYMPLGMGKMFNSVGVNSYAYHNYIGYYYRRGYSWPNLGFTCKFMNDGMTFTTQWPASDLEMMEQSIDDYINEDQFQVYYMTFSGHGPYTGGNCMGNRNIQEIKDLMGDRINDYTYDAQYYLAGNHELDKALEYLLERLEEAGKLENTVIVLTGDHYPYNISDAGRDSLAGHPVDPNFEQYHSDCIIYNAGMEEPLYVDTYCCNVDIYPTILNLFNIPYDSRLLFGTDIFSDGVHRARLYNGSFITDMVKYNAVNGDVEWLVNTDDYNAEDLDNYLNAMIEYTESEYSAATKLLSSNFYFFVWKNSGLMTDEEIQEEITREAQAAERTAEDRAAEAAAAAAAAAAQAELEANGIDTDGDGIPDTLPPALMR